MCWEFKSDDARGIKVCKRLVKKRWWVQFIHEKHKVTQKKTKSKWLEQWCWPQYVPLLTGEKVNRVSTSVLRITHSQEWPLFAGVSWAWFSMC